MDPGPFLSTLLGWAVVLPLLSFAVILVFAKWLGRSAGHVAIAAIGGACLLSFVSLFVWLGSNWPPAPHHHHADAGHHEADDHGQGDHHEKEKAESGEHKTGADWRAPAGTSFVAHLLKAETKSVHPETAESTAAESQRGPYAGEYYALGKFGDLRLNISYYIDSLTVCMFCMVTLIATLIHIYATGYMHDELHDITDHEVTLAGGEELHRPGRYPRFFQYLSLFCFSMLGLVLAGNIAMVFVFWELVGICSYFLIGFYIERKTATDAGNKAFIVNRVGDFGMIIGLMAIWSSVGTFSFGHYTVENADGEEPYQVVSLFDEVTRVAVADAAGNETFKVVPPAGMAIAGSPEKVATIIDEYRFPGGIDAARSEIASQSRQWQMDGAGYWLLVVGGIGIFCGCVGKSAQFPLHVWLPDAMEGPTPVSALVHSATMVAAGVYLAGRFYPFFVPEVLLVIAIVGAITLFLAASIALTAVDIKRVLAYSTVSQLGYMMLSIGLGGWAAGMMHLITHAFFKSLLFMCSGSVIHAVHTNDMRHMGGLLKKMPVTAITMLIGCLAIAGVGVPFLIGFSGYYSKDHILEQGYLFSLQSGSPYAAIFFAVAAGGAAMTAFYMFRLWYLTFVGKPRDQDRYDHAHESPPSMYMPLVILAVFAIAVAWDWTMIGYALFAGAFFIAKGWTDGWFKSGARGQEPGASGHEPEHAHDAHATTHHSPLTTHHAHHGPTLTLTPGWVVTMLVVTILAGWLVQATGRERIENIQIAGNRLSNLTLAQLLEDSRPESTLGSVAASWMAWKWPSELASHAENIVRPVTLLATGTWLFGITLASLMYFLGYLNPAEVRRQFGPLYNLLWNKWYFDELYDFVFVKPTHVISRFVSGIDKRWIDGLIDLIAAVTVWIGRKWDLIVDRGIVDFAANLLAGWTYSTGLSLRAIQTGRIRQYAMFIVLGAIGVFVFIYIFLLPALASGR
ncbi:MAG TPA: proton-conducting transporter membrane subunit [Pirellulaceae bacterium]|nr:proton-conducting transporter membrane subunit [Pirellulaceae bacterium]